MVTSRKLSFRHFGLSIQETCHQKDTMDGILQTAYSKKLRMRTVALACDGRGSYHQSFGFLKNTPLSILSHWSVQGIIECSPLRWFHSDFWNVHSENLGKIWNHFWLIFYKKAGGFFHHLDLLGEGKIDAMNPWSSQHSFCEGLQLRTFLKQALGEINFYSERSTFIPRDQLLLREFHILEFSSSPSFYS